MFLFPQKPIQIYNTKIIPESYNVQIKKNGWRVIIECDKNVVKLFNREGNKLSRGNEANWQFIKEILPYPFYLDGEVVGTRQSGNNLDTIVIWDAPILGENLIKKTYKERYKKLLNFKDLSLNFIDNKSFGTVFLGQCNGFKLFLSKMYLKSEWRGLWNKILIENVEADKIKKLSVNEGLVFKNLNANNLWSTSKTVEHVNQLKLKVHNMDGMW
jgi:hypothetical protein